LSESSLWHASPARKAGQTVPVARPAPTSRNGKAATQPQVSKSPLRTRRDVPAPGRSKTRRWWSTPHTQRCTVDGALAVLTDGVHCTRRDVPLCSIVEPMRKLSTPHTQRCTAGRDHRHRVGDAHSAHAEMNRCPGVGSRSGASPVRTRRDAPVIADLSLGMWRSSPHTQRCTDALVLVQETPLDSHSGDVPLVEYARLFQYETGPHERDPPTSPNASRDLRHSSRARGDAPIPLGPYTPAQMSTPHSQRCTDRLGGRGLGEGVHSARAEMHHCGAGRVPTRTSSLRTCRDVPARKLPQLTALQFTPHTRRYASPVRPHTGGPCPFCTRRDAPDARSLTPAGRHSTPHQRRCTDTAYAHRCPGTPGGWQLTAIAQEVQALRERGDAPVIVDLSLGTWRSSLHTRRCTDGAG